MTKRKTNRQVTLDDIAIRLKVSKVTVSKALRGHPDISDETIAKVKKITKELGYYPNFMARSLSSRRSNAIGVIIPKIAHYFFASVIEGVYDAALTNKYEIIMTVSQENADRELHHVRSLVSMRVDGLIVSVSQQTKDYSIFEEVRKMGIPVTFMDRIPPLKDFNTVVADDFGGAHAATSHAINIGYRKIAHLAGFPYTNIGKERQRGFEAALKEHEIEVKKEWVIQGGFGEEDGYKGFMKLYESGKLPEFIFTVTFPVAFGVYKAAGELGLKIPHDVDLICFGNSGVNQFLSPPMSYVEQPTYELGMRAFQLVQENIQTMDHFISQHIKLPTKLVLCQTGVKKVAGQKS